jgi:hypothetical protein
VTREEKMTAILRAAQKAQPLHLGPIDLYDRLATAVEAALEAKDDESPPVPSGPREGEVVDNSRILRTMAASCTCGVIGIGAQHSATCPSFHRQPPPPLAPKCGRCGGTGDVWVHTLLQYCACPSCGGSGATDSRGTSEVP